MNLLAAQTKFESMCTLCSSAPGPSDDTSDGLLPSSERSEAGFQCFAYVNKAREAFLALLCSECNVIDLKCDCNFAFVSFHLQSPSTADVGRVYVGEDSKFWERCGLVSSWR